MPNRGKTGKQQAGNPADWALSLSQKQREGIIAAQKSTKEGKGIPNEDVWAEFDLYFDGK